MEQIEVRKLFDYNVDGQLFHAQGKKSGTRSGSLHPSGYRRVKVRGQWLREHRLIFLWHHGYLPTVVDHVNGVRDDNRICNLRAATASQNQWNRSPKDHGVHWMSKRRRWRAKVRRYGVDITIGYYKDKEVAIDAMKEFKRTNDQGFIRGDRT